MAEMSYQPTPCVDANQPVEIELPYGSHARTGHQCSAASIDERSIAHLEDMNVYQYCGDHSAQRPLTRGNSILDEHCELVVRSRDSGA